MYSICSCTAINFIIFIKLTGIFTYKSRRHLSTEPVINIAKSTSFKNSIKTGENPSKIYILYY